MKLTVLSLTQILHTRLRYILCFQTQSISQTTHKQGPRQLELCLRCFIFQKKKKPYPGFKLIRLSLRVLYVIRNLGGRCPLSRGSSNSRGASGWPFYQHWGSEPETHLHPSFKSEHFIGLIAVRFKHVEVGIWISGKLNI